MENLLTHKCKPEFNKWLKEKGYGHEGLNNSILVGSVIFYLRNMPESLVLALYVEFFDSVGVYIDSKFVNFEEGWFCVTLNEKYIDSENCMPINHFSTRTEALMQAVKAADKLLNDKLK